jgi:hypothetical protein
MIVFTLLPEAERSEHRQHHYSHIECDVCGKRAPPASESVRHHGLSNMGWFIGPGQHRCAEHYHKDVPARGPQYRDD